MQRKDAEDAEVHWGSYPHGPSNDHNHDSGGGGYTPVMSAAGNITIIDATPEHFDGIVLIERAAGSGSAVALAGAAALEQAMERGHWVAVAVDGDVLAGWIWFSMEIDRGGETTGTVFRIAVAEEAQRAGVATALLERARAVFASREAARIRVTMDAGDEGARAFFEAAGFAAGTLTMERPL